jgi:hypothetical protein
LATGACWPFYKGFRRVTNQPDPEGAPWENELHLEGMAEDGEAIPEPRTLALDIEKQDRFEKPAARPALGRLAS